MLLHKNLSLDSCKEKNLGDQGLENKKIYTENKL
jgi:hypothetical protein